MNVERILRSYPRELLARGRTYAADGRVTDVDVRDDLVAASVRGTTTYRVALGPKSASCTCPAYDREGRCKHIAALALTLASPSALSAPAPSLPPVPPLPSVFKSVYSTSTMLSRLPLYTGEGVRHGAGDYVPLADWWWAARHYRHGDRNALLGRILEVASEVESTLQALKRWQVPPVPKSNGFGELYGALASLYERRAKTAVVGAALPGPLDGRHPGFEFAFDAATRTLELRERRSPFLSSPRRLAAVLPLDEPGRPVRFLNNAFVDHGACDAWDVFALRALLLTLRERTDPAVQALERELGRPMWERVLDQLTGASRQEEAREWRFVLVFRSTLRDSVDASIHLFVEARKPSAGAKAKWKSERISALLQAEVDPLEREIGRLASNGALAALHNRPHAVSFALGTPLAFDLLRLLARHPRVSLVEDARDADTPATITAGTLTMTLDRSRVETLVPRFRVDGTPLEHPVGMLVGRERSPYRWRVDGSSILIVEVPHLLQRWVDLASHAGDALAFPAEATPKLVSAMQPLLEEGLVELPRSALGAELPFEPSPALRVEWKTDILDVEATIEVMIRVHPRAPFAPAGSGPKLFTFEDDGKRVFVERDLARELAIAGDTVDLIDVPGLHWSDGVGEADGLEAALELAAFLARDDLGLPIEVKVGRAPVVRPLVKESKVVVRRMGSWLALEGSFGAGIKLTLGELLEAARLAQRYVRADGGVFVELGAEVIEKLRPLAIAAQLAPSDSPAIHHAFGGLLARASEVFAEVRGDGVDLDELAARLRRAPRGGRVPTIEHGTLRDYQRAGVVWMQKLATWAPGCVLADDMGLGKTVQTAAMLKTRSKNGPALVVSPASVSSNWIAELERFVPSLAVRWYNEDRASLEGLRPGDVVVVSYGLLQRAIASFRDVQWATVVVDEAQYVKNVDAQRSDAVRSLSRGFTIALTGTPLENHLGELFSIVDIAFPGLLGDEGRFRQYFRRPIEVQHDSERLAALGALLAPFLLRRTRAEVLGELPPREEITERLELSEPERKRYLALRNELAKALERSGERRTPSQLRIALLAALTRLRQLACDPGLVDPAYDGPSTKIARVVELVKQLAEEGHSALVFSQFTSFLAKVREALLDADLRVALLTGETPTTERKPIIDAFQRGEFDVFCISLLAGGTGLNLTRASYVIHVDPWWNPAAEEQATARAHRMGQTQPVTVYRVVARGTIEEAVLAMHSEKRQLATAVLAGKGSPKEVSSAELLELLRFGA